MLPSPSMPSGALAPVLVEGENRWRHHTRRCDTPIVAELNTMGTGGGKVKGYGTGDVSVRLPGDGARGKGKDGSDAAAETADNSEYGGAKGGRDSAGGESTLMTTTLIFLQPQL